MILGCGDVDAAQAERWGLVNRALPAASLGAFVEALALRVASFPAEVLALAKATVAAADGPLHDGLIEEELRFREALALPEARRRAERFFANGGQTRPVERAPIEATFGFLAGDGSGSPAD